jgi:hypothetical protein
MAFLGLLSCYWLGVTSKSSIPRKRVPWKNHAKIGIYLVVVGGGV